MHQSNIHLQIWEKKTMRMVIDTKREEDRGKELDAKIEELATRLHDYATHNLPGDIPTRYMVQDIDASALLVHFKISYLIFQL